MKFDQLHWTKTEKWQLIHSGGQASDEATLVLYFGGNGSIDSGERYRDLKERYPKADIAGCSSGGEIVNSLSTECSVVAYALFFEKTRVKLVSNELSPSSNFDEAGHSLGLQLAAEDLAGVIILVDGLSLEPNKIVAGLSRAVGETVPLVGGLAIDSPKLEKSLVGGNAKPLPNTITCIALYGDSLDLRFSTFHGCHPIGPLKQITKSQGKLVQEINDEPASVFFKRFIGDQIQGSDSKVLLFPLRLTPSRDSSFAYNRTVVAIDDSAGTLECAGVVPEGSYVQILRGSLEDLVSAAEIAAEEALASVEERSKYAGVLISCVGRKIAHGEALVAEVSAVTQALGEEVSTIGFYAHGEICPHPETGTNALHNHTMTMFFLGEK